MRLAAVLFGLSLGLLARFMHDTGHIAIDPLFRVVPAILLSSAAVSTPLSVWGTHAEGGKR